MSIVKNKALAGLTKAQFDASTDNSSSVVVWPSVTIGTTTYTFCEYITTNEDAGGRTYIRDVPHSGIVRPTGHDYYPCHNGTTYGVYDKINHTFTPKTVTAYGEDPPYGEDQPYGVGIYDLMWATASGYTDLVTLVAADGGSIGGFLSPDIPATVLQVRTVAGEAAQYTHIKYSFNIRTLPLPPDKTVIENISGVDKQVSYHYEYGNTPPIAPGQLIYGRKPKWNLWADGAPWRSFVEDLGNQNSTLRLSCIDNVEQKVPLHWWDGYNMNEVHKPFFKFYTPLNEDNVSEDNWVIKYYGGEYFNVTGPMNGPVYQNLWLYNYNISSTAVLSVALGNLVDWNKTNTHRAGIYGFGAVVQVPDVFDRQLSDTLITTKYLWSDNLFSNSATFGLSTVFSNLSSAELKTKARDGLFLGVPFNFADGGIVHPEVAKGLYNAFLANGLYLNADAQMNLVAQGTTGVSTTVSDVIPPTPCGLRATFHSEDFITRLWSGLQHNENSTDYPLNVSAAVNHDGYLNIWRNTTAPQYGGVGLVFALTYKIGAAAAKAISNSGISLVCSLQVTYTSTLNGEILGYQNLIKACSRGIYYYDTDPDTSVDAAKYKKSNWADNDGCCNVAMYPVSASDYDYIYAPGESISITSANYGTGTAAEKRHNNLFKVIFFNGEGENDIKVPSNPIGGVSKTTVWKFASQGFGFLLNNAGSTVFYHQFEYTPDVWRYHKYTVAGIYPKYHTGFRGYKIQLSPYEFIFVYPYETLNDNSSATIYFKRYKTKYEGGHYTSITDGADDTPNQTDFSPLTDLCMVFSHGDSITAAKVVQYTPNLATLESTQKYSARDNVPYAFFGTLNSTPGYDDYVEATITYVQNPETPMYMNVPPLSYNDGGILHPCEPNGYATTTGFFKLVLTAHGATSGLLLTNGDSIAWGFALAGTPTIED